MQHSLITGNSHILLSVLKIRVFWLWSSRFRLFKILNIFQVCAYTGLFKSWMTIDIISLMKECFYFIPPFRNSCQHFFPWHPINLNGRSDLANPAISSHNSWKHILWVVKICWCSIFILSFNTQPQSGGILLAFNCSICLKYLLVIQQHLFLLYVQLVLVSFECVIPFQPMSQLAKVPLSKWKLSSLVLWVSLRSRTRSWVLLPHYIVYIL